jgi:hypothetical protein
MLVRRYDSQDESREDLMQDAAIGLLGAIDRFDRRARSICTASSGSAAHHTTSWPRSCLAAHSSGIE